MTKGTVEKQAMLTLILMKSEASVVVVPIHLVLFLPFEGHLTGMWRYETHESFRFKWLTSEKSYDDSGSKTTTVLGKRSDVIEIIEMKRSINNIFRPNPMFRRYPSGVDQRFSVSA